MQTKEFIESYGGKAPEEMKKRITNDKEIISLWEELFPQQTCARLMGLYSSVFYL